MRTRACDWSALDMEEGSGLVAAQVDQTVREISPEASDHNMDVQAKARAMTKA